MFHRILDQAQDLILLAFISLVFGVTKVLTLHESKNCFKCALGTVIVSVVVGTIAGGLALQYQFGDYTSLTISSIASLLSRDLVMAVLKNREYLGDLLKRAAENLVDKGTK